MAEMETATATAPTPTATSTPTMDSHPSLEHTTSVLGGEYSHVTTKYELLETIGRGTFGVVKKCRSKETGEVFAVKSIQKAKVPSLQILRKEVDLLSEVDHPHIIKLYDVFEEEHTIHLVTELCSGGELYDRVVEKSMSPEHHFSEYDAARILRNILDAIAYCHDEKKICHRDLKVENFLLLNERDDAPVKIIDFGLSRFNHDNIMTSRVGTVYYVAPEVLSSQEYTNKCDIWSIGVIAYVLLCGFPPFYGENEVKTLQLVKEASIEFPSPIWDDVSDEAKRFILMLLNRDPNKRPSAQEALQDPWLQHKRVQPAGLLRGASFVSAASEASIGPDSPHNSPVKSVKMRNNRQALFQRFLAMVKSRGLGTILVGVYTLLAWSLLHLTALRSAHDIPLIWSRDDSPSTSSSSSVVNPDSGHELEKVEVKLANFEIWKEERKGDELV